MFATIARSYKIIHTLIFYRLYDYLPNRGIFKLFYLCLWLHPSFYKKCSVEMSRGERLRLALEQLGPLFVKLGQTLSTRPDLIADDIIRELNLLQDRVPAFSGEIAKSIIEKECGKKIEDLFIQFDLESLASASIAQVHSAKLLDGQDVVVKVLRPNVEVIVKHDIRLMYILAKMFSTTQIGRRVRAVEVVREFEFTLETELDLLNEAAAASNVRANFKDSDLLYVPEIYWSYCTSKVMVQERVFFTSITDCLLDKVEVNRKELAQRGVEIFFTQVFRDSFFHADMHPGNIFVDISNPDKPKYCAIDFGIMGSLTTQDQHYLAENFLAFFNRDYRRVAQLHIESGWIPKETRITDFEAAIRRVSEPIFGKTIKDISFGAFLFSLFQTARKFNMHIQPQLVLLQKTFFNIEGLGRRIYPDLDLWQTAKPVLEKWLKKQISPKAALSQLRQHSLEYIDIVPQLPILAHNILQYQDNKNRENKYLKHSVLAGVLLLISCIFAWIFAPELNELQGFGLIATVLLALYLIFRK